MREVIYLFSDKKKKMIFPSLIKWRIGINYSHVAMLVEGKIFQASLGGVNTMSFTDFKADNHIIMSAKTHLSDKAYSYMRAQLGKRYSVLGALAATFRLLRWLRLGDNGDRTYICSEYAYRTHSQDHQHSVNSDYVDPADFERLLEKEGVKLKPGLVLL